MKMAQKFVLGALTSLALLGSLDANAQNKKPASKAAPQKTTVSMNVPKSGGVMQVFSETRGADARITSVDYFFNKRDVADPLSGESRIVYDIINVRLADKTFRYATGADVEVISDGTYFSNGTKFTEIDLKKPNVDPQVMDLAKHFVKEGLEMSRNLPPYQRPQWDTMSLGVWDHTSVDAKNSLNVEAYAIKQKLKF